VLLWKKLLSPAECAKLSRTSSTETAQQELQCKKTATRFGTLDDLREGHVST